MRLNYFTMLGAVLVLTLSSCGATPTNQPLTQAEQPTAAEPVAQKQNAIRSGTFVKAEHPTTGTAQIVTRDGKQVLELDQAFETSSQGPDLYVILYRTEAPPASIEEGDYVSLGRLQKFNGAQSYLIPDDVKLEDYKSVSIWCRQFNATFGYAALNS
jgi:hypothetical protein